MDRPQEETRAKKQLHRLLRAQPVATQIAVIASFAVDQQKKIMVLTSRLEAALTAIQDLEQQVDRLRDKRPPDGPDPVPVPDLAASLPTLAPAPDPYQFLLSPK